MADNLCHQERIRFQNICRDFLRILFQLSNASNHFQQWNWSIVDVTTTELAPEVEHSDFCFDQPGSLNKKNFFLNSTGFSYYNHQPFISEDSFMMEIFGHLFSDLRDYNYSKPILPYLVPEKKRTRLKFLRRHHTTRPGIVTQKVNEAFCKSCSDEIPFPNIIFQDLRWRKRIHINGVLLRRWSSSDVFLACFSNNSSWMFASLEGTAYSFALRVLSFTSFAAACIMKVGFDERGFEVL